MRNVVERSFGIFKRRWRIFDRSHEFSFRKQKQLVYALVAAHNFINLHYQVGDDFESFEPYPLEQSDAELSIETDDSNLIDDREMDGRRDEIAREMWKAYSEYRERIGVD